MSEFSVHFLRVLTPSRNIRIKVLDFWQRVRKASTISLEVCVDLVNKVSLSRVTSHCQHDLCVSKFLFFFFWKMDLVVKANAGSHHQPFQQLEDMTGDVPKISVMGSSEL